MTPDNYGESQIVFGTPPNRGARGPDFWSIKFQPYAFHAGDEQPLSIDEARKLSKEGEDLELMHIPIGKERIPFGENYHTLTDRDFDSVLGRVRKPVALTREIWNRSIDASRINRRRSSWKPWVRATFTTAQKVELLQSCMVGMRIVDSGSRSKKEAKQAFSRLLNNRRFNASVSDEDFFRLNWDPMAYIFDPPGVRQETTTTFMQVPSDRSCTEDDGYPHDYVENGYILSRLQPYQTVELRALAAHEGDRKPVPVAKAKALESTKLMQVPLGHIRWMSEEERPTDTDVGVWEHPVEWTWTEDWEEPVEWAWADGWEKPVELTWGNVSGFDNDYKEAFLQKIIFLRHYLKMVYIEDAGELCKKDIVAAIEDLTGIELRHDTSSLGRDYWWKVQHDGSPTRPSSRSSGCSSGSRGNSSRNTLLDLYGGDEELAHTHYWNTH